MAKQIAVWGSRASGKTTLSVKLSDALSKKGSVILVFCDREVPVLPALFPKHRDGEIRSLGAALSSVELNEETVLSCATVSDSDNIVYLGYAEGENLYSYPAFGEARADFFIDTLGRMADYVIYDCPSSINGNFLACEALNKADTVFRLYTPDITSFLFFSSQLPVLSSDEEKLGKHRKILSCTEGEVCLPESEALAYMKECDVLIPHSKQIKQFAADGALPGSKPGRKYAAAITKICEMAEKSDGE